MATDSILLHGGGEHGRVVLTSLLDERKKIIGIFDPKFSGEWNGVKFLGSYSPTQFPETPVIVSIGDNHVRKKAVSATRHAFSVACHPTAYFSSFAQLGPGCMVLQGVIVQQGADIGNHVILNTACRIDHDCRIGDFSHIAPGVVLSGNVQVGEGTFIGAGATVIPGIKIGAWSVIGAGSVVIRDVGEGEVVAGNPARALQVKQ